MREQESVCEIDLLGGGKCIGKIDGDTFYCERKTAHIMCICSSVDQRMLNQSDDEALEETVLSAVQRVCESVYDSFCCGDLSSQQLTEIYLGLEHLTEATRNFMIMSATLHNDAIKSLK